jgi:hypothetical protein
MWSFLQFFYRIDSNLPPTEGAAVSSSYATAYLSLVRHGRIKSGLVFGDVLTTGFCFFSDHLIAFGLMTYVTFTIG